MGFVQPGKPDIFVSYARVNDQNLDGDDEPGWVTTLVRYLRKQLDEKLGRIGAIEMWMDHQLATGSALDRAIEGKVRDSQIMLILLSPGYLESSWCRREMELFLGEETKRRTGTTTRVFVVEIDRVDWPEPLRHVLRKPFWDPDPDDPSRTHTLGFPRPNPRDPADKQYYLRLESLVQDLAREMKRLKAEAGTAGPAEPPIPAARAVVYLARSTSDVSKEYLEVREFLIQQRFDVVPRGEYPRDEAGFLASARDDLKSSALFVQVLGGLAGSTVTGTGRSHVVVQHACAGEAGKPILRWRRPDLDLDEVAPPEHAAQLASADVLAVELWEFKDLVLKRLEEILRPARAPTPRPRSRTDLNKMVFVNADTADLPLADDLVRTLRGLGAWVTVPYQDDEEINPREYMAEKLQECDVFMLVYGGTKSKWVDRQLLLSRKPLSLRATAAGIAVVQAAPPEPKEPLTVLPPNMKIFRGQPVPSEAELEEFLRSL
jgi:hypothetical protein